MDNSSDMSSEISSSSGGELKRMSKLQLSVDSAKNERKNEATGVTKREVKVDKEEVSKKAEQKEEVEKVEKAEKKREGGEKERSRRSGNGKSSSGQKSRRREGESRRTKEMTSQ